MIDFEEVATCLFVAIRPFSLLINIPVPEPPYPSSINGYSVDTSILTV